MIKTMKKLILTTAIILGLGTASFAQGTLFNRDGNDQSEMRGNRGLTPGLPGHGETDNPAFFVHGLPNRGKSAVGDVLVDVFHPFFTAVGGGTRHQDAVFDNALTYSHLDFSVGDVFCVGRDVPHEEIGQRRGVG